MMARSVASRIGWSLLALSPAALALVLPAPLRWLTLGAAIAFAVATAAITRALRADAWRHWHRDPGALLSCVLAWVWIQSMAPSASGGPLAAAAIAAAVHSTFGGTGQSPFHPAAVGAAAVLLLAPGAHFALSEPITTIALAIGGLLMLGRKLVSPMSVLGWFAGLVAGSLLAGRLHLAPLDWLTPAHLLVGFFVLADGSAGLRTPARLFCGLAGGVLASTLPGPAALPCAVLLANLLAPSVEQALLSRARA